MEKSKFRFRGLLLWMLIATLMIIGITDYDVTANPLVEVDLASDTAWTLSIDGGVPRSIKVPGGGWNSDLQSPTIDKWYGVNEYVLYQRSITIPNQSATQVTKILFGAVNFGAEVYLNDTLVAAHHGAMMPFEADLTNYVTPGGSYTLKVKALHKKWYLNRYGGQCPVPIGFDYQAGAPPVSGFNSKFSYGITKYVKIAVYPQVYIKDVFVRPSVVNNNFYFDVWVDNHSSGSRSITIQGNLTSWNGDTWAYPVIPNTGATVPGNTVQKVTVGPITWGLGPGSYWWPNIPFSETYTAKLHNLDLSIKEGPVTLDTKTQRFGFRECAEGPNYYMINGVRINHISDGTTESGMSEYDCYSVSPAFLPPTGPNTGCPETWKRYMRLGINTNRICQSTPTEYMLNAADEVGFMCVAETAIRGYDSNWQLWDDTYLPQAEKELARVCRNHPSVIRYSLANEWYNDPRLIEAIITEDNSRPLVFETHPYNNYPCRIDSANGHAYTMNHYTSYPQPATIISGMGEYAWSANGLEECATTGKKMRKNDLSYFAGWDWINYWPNLLQGMSHAKHAWTPDNHADRTDGVDGWNSHVVNYVQRSFHPYLVMDNGIEDLNNYSSNWPGAVPTYAAGDTINRNIEIFNGGLTGNSMTLQWEARWDSPAGALVTAGSFDNLTIEPGFHTTKTISFNAPAPGQSVRNLYIVMKSIKGGLEVYREDRVYVKLSSTSVPADAQFLSADTVTQGNWDSLYGTEGHVTIAKENNAPGYAAITWGGAEWTWDAATSDVRALKYFANPPTGSDRIAACQYGSPVTFDLDVGDSYHNVAMYLLDWDNQGRTQTVEIRKTDNTLLASQSTGSFNNGKYLIFKIKGSVRVNVIKTGSGPNAVISGLYFDAASGGSTSTPLPTPTPTPVQGVNLALGKTASASSQWDGNYPANKANDGDALNTRWAAADGTGVGEWLEIDFGANTIFDQVITREFVSRIAGYKIQYWNGSNWADACAGGIIGSSKTDTFAAVTSNKIRLYITAVQMDGGYSVPSIYEFEVYNTGGATATPTPTPASNISFATVVSLGSEIRNDYSDYVGMKITVGGSNITVKELGRYFVSGNSGSHTIKIVRVSDHADLGSVSLNMATGTADALGYKYATLATPVTLSANTAYYIVAMETSGGDQWYGINPTGLPTLTTTGAATVDCGIYLFSGAWYPCGSADRCYVPLNFKY